MAVCRAIVCHNYYCGDIPVSPLASQSISDTIFVTPTSNLDNFHKTRENGAGTGRVTRIFSPRRLTGVFVSLIDDLIFDTLRGPIRMQSGELISSWPLPVPA